MSDNSVIPIIIAILIIPVLKLAPLPNRSALSLAPLPSISETPFLGSWFESLALASHPLPPDSP
jgi:hypothetical protein